MGEWVTRIGEAAAVGAVIAFFLDRYLVNSVGDALGGATNSVNETLLLVNTATQDGVLAISTSVDTHVDRIKASVFEGVLGTIIEPDVFSTFHRTVLHCPVYRDPFKLILTLTLVEFPIQGVATPYLKREWHEEYYLRSLQTPSAGYEIKVGLETDDVPELKQRCGITEIRIGDITEKGKATADIRDAAQQYTPEALQTLVTVMCKGKSEVARLAAANAILDRGHGKPQQFIDATHRVITDPAELTYEQLSEIARGGLGSAHGKPH